MPYTLRILITMWLRLILYNKSDRVSVLVCDVFGVVAHVVGL